MKKKNWKILSKKMTAAILAAIVAFGAIPFSNEKVIAKAAEATEEETPSTSESTDDPNIPAGSGLDYDYARALQYSMYFYDANMCGTDVSEHNLLSWRGNCHTYDSKVPLKPMDEKEVGTNLSQEYIDKYKDVLDPDGDGYVDVAGGFHDAGDHVKFGMPENYSAAALGWGYYEFRDSYTKLNQNSHIETILRYFNDYLMKCTFRDKKGKVVAHCYQVGDGNIDHNYWESPEVDSMARPAYFLNEEKPQTDYVASAVASLTINYLNFKDTDPEYAAKSLDYAKALWDFANTNEKELSINGDGPKAFYYSNKWEDDYCWAGAWLYKATEDVEYLNQILPYIDYYAPSGWAFCWNDVWSGAITLLGEIDLEHPELDLQNMYRKVQSKTQYESADFWEQIEKAIDTWMTHYTTPGGYAFLNTWGSARYNTAMQLVTLIYEKYHTTGEPSKYAKWAESQMKYLMGNNKLNRCYIVGYNQHSVKYPHHRAASGLLSAEDPREQKHVLFGALAGGPDGQDDHHDTTADWVYNEVTIDYNAAFVGACAALYHFFGTKDMAITENFPPAEVAKPGEEEEKGYWVEAFAVDDLHSDGAGVTKISMKVMTGEAAAKKDISVRYFFNAEEISDIKNVSVKELYDQASAEEEKADGVISQPIAYEKMKNVYYYEVKWDGYAIANSGKKYQCLAGMYYGDKWDPTNDYSYQGLPVLTDSDMFGNGNEVRTDRICVYSDGVLVGGIEPDGTTPDGEKKDPSDEPAKEIPVSEIAFREKEKTLTVGESFDLTVTVKPTNATNKTLTWHSSDDSIVTVKNGKITAIKPGSAVVTASSADGKKSAICTVTVNKDGDTPSVKPSDEKPSTTKPSDTKPSTINPSDATPSDEKPSTINPSDATPSDEKPSMIKPSDTTPSDEKPSTTKPSDTKPSNEKPSTTKPSDVKPSDEKPSTTKPSDVKPSDEKPSTTKPSDVKPSDEKPSTTKPSDVKPSDEKPSTTKPSGDSSVAVEKVVFDESSCKMTVKTQRKLSYQILPENATNKNVTFIAENPEILSIDKTGTVTALAVGTSKVKIKTDDGNKIDTCSITVTPEQGGSSEIAVTDVSLNPDTPQTLNIGDTLQILAHVIPENADNQKILYESKYPTIASVDANGCITAKQVGETKITVRSVDGNYTKSFVVTVKSNHTPVQFAEFTKSMETMKIGAIKKLELSISPEDADTSTLQWSSDAENIVSVTQKGEIRAWKSGTAVVTVTSEEGRTLARCMITVTSASVAPKSITLNKKNFTTTVGKTILLKANVKPKEAKNEFTFKSKNNKIIKLSSVKANSVKLNAKTPGKVTILVAAKGYPDVTKKITIQVKPAKVTGVRKIATGAGKVKLTWKKQQGVTGYEVYYYNPKKKKYSLYKKLSKNTLVAKLTGKTSYKFKVRAYKNNNPKLYGAYSSVLKVKIK